MSILSPLAATFELRFKQAWDLCYENKREEAETVAAELLLEPRLGRFHQAGMHLLLAMSPDDYIDHALEAVRLYSEMGRREGLTDVERDLLEKLLNDANHVLNKARQDQTVVDRKIQKLLRGRASGMTMDDLHEAQIEEMHKRLDAEEAGAEGDDDDNKESENLPDSQDVPEMTEDSQMTGTESQRTVTGPSRSVSIADSQRTETGYLDDDEPLPDIVRYKFDDKAT
ncbi:hypothetical protein ACHAP5_004920 [Fusarium lateritium]